MVGINISHTLPENKVTDYTNHGVCSQCGNCCSNMLPLTEHEIKIIRRYVKTHNIKPHVLPAILATPTIDLTCPFLDTTKSTQRCKIYAVRPYICKCFICSDLGGIGRYTTDKKFKQETRTTINMRNTFFPNK